MVRRDRVEVVQAPRFRVAPRPDARHSEGRQGLDLVERHLEPLVDRDGVEVGVVGTRSVPGEHQRNRFVEVVDRDRVILVEHARHGLRQLERLLMGVAVVVVEHVVAPVRRRHLGQVFVVGLSLEVPVEPVRRLVPPVGLRDGIDENDHVLADPIDHRLVRDREAVGELHDHLGAARLGRVEAGVEVIDRPGGLDESARPVPASSCADPRARRSPS